ncbi:MAG: N-acetylmuramoyl-L-alanine amidase [Actinomycetota bacterium]|nr:N-acetylmuramoyl-L-alanine amidase [Actinomycetota bacterium]MDP2287748.1 N-acetylmuramoyl-L-alanine amidase [Actinomycetota bacterium]
MKRFAAVLLGTLILVAAPSPTLAADGVLAGAVIALDPGHQLGNSNPKFSSQMKQKRFNGTIVKSCNTTGTATNKGLPEATFTWRVSQQLKKLLEDQGARVELTRTSNSRDSWGPCVWDRGGFSQKVGANLFVSIHGDGAPAKGRGFHVIAPGRIKAWTNDIAAGSRTLARSMIDGMQRAGATPATYLSSPLSVRTDQSTLNFNGVPAVIVELGNMRNAQDAAQMSSTAGVKQYAQQIATGISRYCAVQSRCR